MEPCVGTAAISWQMKLLIVYYLMKALSTCILGPTCPLSNVQGESLVCVALLRFMETFDREGWRVISAGDLLLCFPWSLRR